MLESYNRLFGITRRALIITGLDPLKWQAMTLIWTTSMSSLMILLAILGFFYDELTTKKVIALVTTILPLIHVMIKIVAFSLNKKEIQELIRNMDDFWPIENLMYSAEFRKDCLKILNFCRILFHAFNTYIALMFLAILVTEFTNGGLGFTVYIPRSIPYPVFLMLNNFAFGYSTYSAVGGDFLIITLIILLLIQFKILNENLKLSVDKFVREQSAEFDFFEMVKIHVKYHNFLLEQFDKLNRILGPMLFVHLWVEIGSMCFMLYCITESKDDVNVSMKYVFYLVGVMTEVFIFYSLPAELLSNEAFSLSTNVYNSGWYSCPYVSIKRALLMMMLRAQRGTRLWAGKVMAVDLATCTMIFKTTLSFYTFLQNIRQK